MPGRIPTPALYILNSDPDPGANNADLHPESGSCSTCAVTLKVEFTFLLCLKYVITPRLGTKACLKGWGAVFFKKNYFGGDG